MNVNEPRDGLRINEKHADNILHHLKDKMYNTTYGQ
jgi:hypothetical protein